MPLLCRRRRRHLRSSTAIRFSVGSCVRGDRIFPGNGCQPWNEFHFLSPDLWPQNTVASLAVPFRSNFGRELWDFDDEFSNKSECHSLSQFLVSICRFLFSFLFRRISFFETQIHFLLNSFYIFFFVVHSFCFGFVDEACVPCVCVQYVLAFCIVNCSRGGWRLEVTHFGVSSLELSTCWPNTCSVYAVRAHYLSCDKLMNAHTQSTKRKANELKMFFSFFRKWCCDTWHTLHTATRIASFRPSK